MKKSDIETGVTGFTLLVFEILCVIPLALSELPYEIVCLFFTVCSLIAGILIAIDTPDTAGLF